MSRNENLPKAPINIRLTNEQAGTIIGEYYAEQLSIPMTFVVQVMQHADRSWEIAIAPRAGSPASPSGFIHPENSIMSIIEGETNGCKST